MSPLKGLGPPLPGYPGLRYAASWAILTPSRRAGLGWPPSNFARVASGERLSAALFQRQPDAVSLGRIPWATLQLRTRNERLGEGWVPEELAISKS